MNSSFVHTQMELCINVSGKDLESIFWTSSYSFNFSQNPMRDFSFCNNSNSMYSLADALDWLTTSIKQPKVTAFQEYARK